MAPFCHRYTKTNSFQGKKSERTNLFLGNTLKLKAAFGLRAQLLIEIDSTFENKYSAFYDLIVEYLLNVLPTFCSYHMCQRIYK